MRWFHRRHASGQPSETKPVPPMVLADVADLRNLATAVTAKALELANELGDLDAQVERLDDELGRSTGEERAELEAQRAELDLELGACARHVDALLALREGDLARLAALERQYGLQPVRLDFVGEDLFEDRTTAGRPSPGQRPGGAADGQGGAAQHG